MKCFEINLNQLANILSFGKEHLIPSRVHITRKINCYIIYAVTDGELSLLHNGKPLVLKSGDVFVFTPDDTQKPLGESICEYYYVHFDADIKALELETNALANKISQKNLAFANSRIYGKERYYNRSLLLPEKSQITEKVDYNYITNKFEQNIKVFRRSTINENLSLSFDLFKILLKLENICEKNYSGKALGRIMYSTANKIAEFLNLHYLEPVDSLVIEKEFMINYDYANHLFKTAIGESIMQYRNSRRIERAKFLLTTTDMRIEEIATESGFTDKFYFTRYFTKCTGVSPTRFREAERGNV